MTEYKVTQDYKDEIDNEVVNIRKGQTVTLDEALAERINRNAPDTLKEVKSRTKKTDKAQGESE